ncbi:DUF2767 family protein [Erwiniaceae bacterium BAC15a-03b]|uniref:Fumarase D n=1 Tax=Winslowiella arboricola TaxID=2978220 RepID=A0A9J6PXE1_9GAMM|nr:DUF2767 family protein [Winslowiella arboricola]MCU5775141.1 DUF2767 family protein [Winslowiella arboricola]MCU5780405.1 DUF2767 family protein [Winslowiella arboricola]
MSTEPPIDYDEMCRVVGDMVFTLHDLGIESEQVVIADALKRALQKMDIKKNNKSEHAMEAAVNALEN